MNKSAQRVHVRARSRYRLLFHCSAVALLVAAGLAAPGYAEQRPAKAASASNPTPAPAYSQLERLDEKALGAIRGKGGTDALQLPINLGIILWDEPGSGGTKPHALAENNGSSIPRLISGRYESYGSVSISTR